VQKIANQADAEMVQRFGWFIFSGGLPAGMSLGILGTFTVQLDHWGNYGMDSARF
jgi:acyl dehydratase